MEMPVDINAVEPKALRPARECTGLAGDDSEREKPESASALTDRLKRAYRRQQEMCR